MFVDLDRSIGISSSLSGMNGELVMELKQVHVFLLLLMV